jgi:type IV pilus assembly protein PilM
MILSAKKKKSNAVVGVDIDAESVAAATPGAGDGDVTAQIQKLPDGAFSAGEIVDPAAVSEALRELFSQTRLPKQVRLAVASQGVAFRTLRLPLIEDPEQLRNAVRFQAQEQIPIPLDAAVLDHQVIAAHVEDDGTRQVDVAVVAARRQSVETLLGAARDAGLDPVGIDFAAFGMIRALAGAPAAATSNGGAASKGGTEPGVGAEAYVPATLYCSLGGITNLAISRGFACLFSRVAQFGVRDIALELVSSTDLSLEHAEQWLVHTGLQTPLEELEGDAEAIAAARSALQANVASLADELRISLDYYGAQEGATAVEEIALCGWGSAIPGLAETLGETLGREVSVRRPSALSALPDLEAARLTVPYGLALEQ